MLGNEYRGQESLCAVLALGILPSRRWRPAEQSSKYIGPHLNGNFDVEIFFSKYNMSQSSDRSRTTGRVYWDPEQLLDVVHHPDRDPSRTRDILVDFVALGNYREIARSFSREDVVKLVNVLDQVGLRSSGFLGTVLTMTRPSLPPIGRHLPARISCGPFAPFVALQANFRAR